MRDLKLPGGSILENENDRHKNVINCEENCNYAIRHLKRNRNKSIQQNCAIA